MLSLINLSNMAATIEIGKAFEVLLPIGLILLTAKFLSIIFAKLKVPSVIGFLVAGLLIGLITLIPGETILTPYTMLGIDFLAKIGVVLIMFSTGLETNLKKIKAVGGPSVLITILGVIAPLGLGFLVAFLFRVYGGIELGFLPEGVNPIYSDIFYGTILTATSVSITVATLKELGKLDGKVGSALVAAAILDDIIGIIVLSLVVSLSGASNGAESTNVLKMIIEAAGGTLNSVTEIVVIIANMSIFFLLSIGAGWLIRRIFNWLGQVYPHHIRIPIFSFAFCFIWAWLGERYFQISDITGAFIAGLIFSATKPHDYIDHRTETTANVFFVPVFFASVAMKMYDAEFDFANGIFMAFGVTWVIVGLLSKVLGATTAAKISGFDWKDSLATGVGMMARAEVLIVAAQMGIDTGLVDPQIMPFALLLILASSFLTPFALKLIYKNKRNANCDLGEIPQQKD